MELFVLGLVVGVGIMGIAQAAGAFKPRPTYGERLLAAEIALREEAARR